MKDKCLLLIIMLFSVNLLNAQIRPKLSTDAVEHWYYLKFSNGGNVIQDMGNNANLQTKAKIEGNASQLWKFTGEKDNYIIVSKNGRKINYTSDRFQANATSYVKFKLISTSNTSYAPAWELQQVGQSLCINQWEKAGVDRELGQWKAGDKSNVLLFIAQDPNTDLIPEESSLNDEIWYYIQFKRGGGTVLQDIGDGKFLKTKVARKQDSQLWKVISTPEGYIIESKLGNKIYYSGNYFQTSANNYSTFEILFTTNTNYAPALELQRVETQKCMNQWESPGINRLLGEWKLGDQNNSLVFVKPEKMTDLQEADGKIKESIGCTKLKNLQLPTCTAIGEGAFFYCSSLEKLMFPFSNPPQYGKNAFSTPENIYVELDNQNASIVNKWRSVKEWSVFKWKNFTNIADVTAPKWTITTSGNNLIISGLTSGVEVSIVSITGVQQRFMPSQEGILDITLPSGFYIVSQQDNSEKIIITQ
ncbi:hypothetical protein M2138_000057 [Dysgonomonadaceae bacterium PH5-43]|nr:hypothetical protein [Dysgonomonadaceae bacterium PH5-43]